MAKIKRKVKTEVINKFYNFERDGITQGLLAKFMECRQKARWFLQGWQAKGTSMALTYGNIVHAILEYAYEDIRLKKITTLPSEKQVRGYSARVEREWRREHPTPTKEALEYLELSLLIAEATLPIYFEFWRKDIKELPWMKLEAEFKLPWEIKDLKGNVIAKTFLRGKMDGLYQRAKEWLFETKTKAYIEENDLIDLLPFELQVMFYLVVRRRLSKKMPAGVLYNVIRRIGLQRGKGRKATKNKKAVPEESIKSFAARCVKDIKARPDYYFLRLEVKITEQELDAFEMQLEDMIRDFYYWLIGQAGHYRNSGACISRYGRCKFLTACAGGSMAGYEKRKQVFNELEEV